MPATPVATSAPLARGDERSDIDDENATLVSLEARGLDLEDLEDLEAQELVRLEVHDVASGDGSIKALQPGRVWFGESSSR